MNKTLRLLLLTIFVISAPVILKAGDKEKFCLTGGLEWGYSLTSRLYSHYNFYANTGIRVDIKDNTLNVDSNGFISGHFGVKFLRKFAITASGGYYGLQSERRSTLISARASYYFKDYLSDSFIIYLEGGKGLADTFDNKGIYLAKLGGSYQFKMSSWMNLFLSMSFQAVTDHPDSYYDKIGKTSVTSPDLLRSDAYYGAINFSVGLNF